MFHRELTYGTNRLVIHLKGEPAHSRGDLHFLGFPLYENLGAVDNDTLPDVIDEIKGYFLYVGIDENHALVANDIAGGFRTYTGQVGDTTYLSDDYSFILDQLRDQAPLEIDEHEYEFWEKHRYTTGGATFVRRCDKLPPASVLTVDQSGIKIRNYFSDLSADIDASRHSRLFVDDLSDTLRSLSREKRPIFLFISGGNDSTLLALMMRELKIDFTPVFVKLNPSYPANQSDSLRAEGVARYLGLTLKELDINVANVIGDIESIAREMIFDRHFSLLHFGAMRQLQREYGTDLIIVNGQSCDAVLSHGPSANSKGDFAARVLCHRPMTLWSSLAGLAVKVKHGWKYAAPRTEREYLLSRLDPFRYYSVLEKRHSHSYRGYLGEITDSLQSQFNHRTALNIYLSVYSYLQGSDNQVVIRSARSNGIERVIMPYASPQIIYATAAHRDSSKEIRHPKYPVTDALRKLGFNYKAKVNKGDVAPSTDLERLVSQVESEFFRQAARLTAANSRRVTG
jgi:hypothetical protein